MAVAALTAASAAMSLIGGISSYVSAGKEGKYNQQVVDINAQQARHAAEANEADYRYQASREQATARARAAASGVASDSRSPLLVAAENAQNAELNALRLRYQGTVAETGFQNQKELIKYNVKKTQISTILNTGKSLLTSASLASKAGGGGSVAMQEPWTG